MDWKSGGDTNFAPIATADGELDCRGFWSKDNEHPDKDATLHVERRAVPDAARLRRRASAPTSGGCAPSSSSRRTTRRRCAASTATTTTASTPTHDGWVVRIVARAHRQPGQLHAADGLRPGRPARSGDRDPRAAAPGRAVRRRHPAPLARGRPQRRRAPLRADHQLRERPRARRAGSSRSSPPPDTPRRPSTSVGRLPPRCAANPPNASGTRALGDSARPGAAKSPNGGVS